MAGGGKEVGKSDGELKRGGSRADLPVKVMNSPAEISHVEETGRRSVPSESSIDLGFDPVGILGGPEKLNALIERSDSRGAPSIKKDAGLRDESDCITDGLSNPKVDVAGELLTSGSSGGGSDTPQEEMAKSCEVPKPALPLQRRKKLLVLNLVGFLVASYKRGDRYQPLEIDHCAVGVRVVYKRPFCDTFLQFCFENFHVGMWTSLMGANAHKILDFVCGGAKKKLAFIMSQADCTDTGFTTPEDSHRPLFLKELTKVWATFRPGEFNASNTLLIDDSPHKALRNPPFTGVFPESYGSHNGDDNFLAGTFRVFLEGLRDAPDVQDYVETHPIGMPPITEKSSGWSLYRRISTIDDLSSKMRNVSMSEMQPGRPRKQPTS